MLSIEPGLSVRDATYLATNLRDWDRREIAAQLGESFDPYMVAGMAVAGAGGEHHAFTVFEDGSPIGCYGLTQSFPHPTLYSAWSWGSRQLDDHFWAVTRRGTEFFVEQLVESSAQRVEIRALKGHPSTRWFNRLRLHLETELVAYGVNGETFELWVWDRVRLADTLPKIKSSGAGWLRRSPVEENHMSNGNQG